jgi:hypothetical protein
MGEATIEVDPATMAVRVIGVGITAIVDMSPHMEHIVAADIPAEDGPMEHRMAVAVTAVATAAVIAVDTAVAVTAAVIDS